MPLKSFIAGFLVVVPLCLLPAGPQASGSDTHDNRQSIPLILEKNEGERRVRRFVGNTMGTLPFILKVDAKNGASQHLVVFAEDVPPGVTLPLHKHPYAEEILVLQTGRSRVHLGNTVRVVGPGATVFIPADTLISVDNIGTEPVSLVAIFSEPGFDEYMRAISVREGENSTPMSKTELDAIRAQHSHDVSYK